MSPVMSFKEYYSKSITLKNITFIDGWGWFIDLESNIQIYPDKYNNQKQNPHLETINEISSLKSFKSMSNLYIEDDLENFHKYKHKHKHITWIIHSICILGVIGVFYVCNIL